MGLQTIGARRPKTKDNMDRIAHDWLCQAATHGNYPTVNDGKRRNCYIKNWNNLTEY